MKDEEARLLELAERVSDGSRIPWDEAESSLSPDQIDLLEDLKTLESLARFHRSPRPPTESSTGASVDTWAELEIIELLGSGSFGEVYRARDPRLRREVALKLRRAGRDSDSGRKHTIIREGRILARLKHPNVATVYGAAEERGRVGVWMELIHGRTLAEIVDDQGPMGAREAAGIGVDVCRAVAAVHREGLVHRDIKAQNVMRERGGRIVLMDFGLGAALPRPGGTSSVSLSGTPLYMAPELFRGKAASVQSDIYAVGVLLFHLVTGKYPVNGRDLDDLSQKHQENAYTLLRDVRPDLAGAFIQVVERALAPRPQDRFLTVGELEQALDRTLPSAGATLETESEDAAAGGRGRRIWPAAVLVATILLVAAALWSGWFEPPREPGKIPIAVVGFKNFTGDPELQWLEQGIPDQLIYSLSRSNYLQVRSMDRVLEVLNQPGVLSLSDHRRTQALAERARVNYVVEGRVYLNDEGRLTIISQINDLTSNSLLASQKVAGAGADDLFEIVNELSRDIRRALEIETEDSPEVKAGVARLKTDSKDAYKSYVNCRQVLHGRRYEEALPHCREAVSEDPDFLHAWDLLANVYDNMGERRLALEALRNAVRLLDRVPRTDQLTVLLRQAQIEENWRDYEQYLKELQLLQPEDPTWPFRLGWHYATHVRDYDLAVREYRQALSKGAEPRVHGYACFALLSAARYAEALQSCRRFVQESPGDASAHDNLGYLYMVRGEYSAAREAFQEALSLRPNFSHALQNMGELELSLGRVEQARRHFDSFLAQATGEKQEIEARFSLAWFHWVLKELEPARQAVAAVLREDPERVRALWLRGLIQLDQGDLAGARQSLAEIDGLLKPNSSLRRAEFRLHLAGSIARAEDRPADAVPLFRRALDLGPSDRPFFLVALAHAQLDAGRPDAAADRYREALDVNPRHVNALLGLARLRQDLGEQEAALETYRRAWPVLSAADKGFPGREQTINAIQRLGGGADLQ